MKKIRHRLLFALRPPQAKHAEIARHRDGLTARGHVRDDRFHITLGITDDYDAYPEAEARRMIAIGDSIAVDPFTISLDRLAGSASSVALRPSHRPWGLSDLSRQLNGELVRWRLRREGWHFSPHLTLLYWEGQPFLVPVAPIAWEATDFVLIHSLVGETRHTELGRWSLISLQQSFVFF
jgi:2'-5' RNA ligase